MYKSRDGKRPFEEVWDKEIFYLSSVQTTDPKVILPALLPLAQGNLIMANPLKPLWQENTALPAPCPQKGAPETPEVP